MDNVLFTIDVNNTVAVWAPLNSWEPHILYQRASINMDGLSETVESPPAKTLSTLCIIIDSTELTKALETVFNRINGDNVEKSENLEIVSDIARKSPELCLVVNQQGNNLCIWGIDVTSPGIYYRETNQYSKWIAGMANRSTYSKSSSGLYL
jgi:hypothetical protein